MHNPLRYIVIVLAAVLLTSGCSDGPDDVFKKCQRAIHNGQYDLVWDSMSPDLQQQFKEQRQEMLDNANALLGRPYEKGSAAERYILLYTEATGVRSMTELGALEDRELFLTHLKGSVTVYRTSPFILLFEQINIPSLVYGVVQTVSVNEGRATVELRISKKVTHWNESSVELIRLDGQWKFSRL